MKLQTSLIKLNQIIDTGDYVNHRDFLARVLTDRNLLAYFAGKLPTKLPSLRVLDFLWELMWEDTSLFVIFRIFNNSIVSLDNSKYAVSFIARKYHSSS